MARFATSARAVDMLGRQQIATVPTAISELFKNSYDAYARRVRADYYPERKALLIRDDGVGMSLDDFLQRWLVLGTDSKAADSSRPRPPRPPNALPRPIMGEKGIGRLAVAAIGPQVLVVTRPAGPIEPRPTVVALVQWSMFEIPGLLLEDVLVPMLEIDRAWPEPADLEALVSQVLSNLENLGKRVPESLQQRIFREVTSLTLPDRDMAVFDGPVLSGDGHGTHFLVMPVHEELDAAMRPTTDEQRADRSTDFERLLIGFTNTMLPGASHFPMTAAFFVHQPDAVPQDLIAPVAFWEPEDFTLVDHDIQGEFDETGRFTGSVSVYGQAPAEHVVAWPGAAGRPTRCGPFRLRIGYLQGNPKESRLDPTDYSATQAKLARIGGLYVYRDGIRVLPYGSADVDYLGIEERRSRNAGRYYFSYRRMFGSVEISSIGNPRLRDKASREGLLDNVAFREFRAILENFLMQTAADFFRRGGDNSTDYMTEKARLRAQEDERRRASARAAERRARFAAELQKRLDDLESGRVQAELDGAVADLREQVLHLRGANAKQLVNLEREARQRLQDVADRLVLSQPENVGLTDEIDRDLREYRARESAFRVRQLPTAIQQVVDVVGRDVDPLARSELVDARLAALGEQAELAMTAVAAAGAQVELDMKAVAADVQREVSRRIQSVEQVVRQVRLQFTAWDVEADDQQRALSRLQEQANAEEVSLAALGSRLRQIFDDRTTQEARLLQERLLALEKQVDTDIDLLLLGQAVQVIDHELEQTVGAARDALSRLKPLARSDLRLREGLDAASSAFEHLDGYLRLFTPLQRRLRRQRSAIPGTRIVAFLDSLLGDKLRRHNVRLKASRSFRNSETNGFASTFLPVFVNLTDNAVHWAASINPDGGGVVELDRDDDGDLLVRDNGPGVSERDREIVFASGFTRRSGGRGLGLTISQTALRREGWSLTVDPPDPAHKGAVFRLHRHEEM
jgi:signal transduction histidine kinase